MEEKLTITIRQMQPEDAGAMHRIEEECFSQPWSEDAFSSACEDSNYLWIVAEDNGKVIGYVGCQISYDEADITNVAVSAVYRRRRIAENLLMTLKRKLSEDDVKQVFLEVRQSNEPAIHLYEKQNFEPVGLRKGFYSFPKEDAILMRAEL